MLGISTYFQDFDAEYIKSAIEVGISFIFTSLHINEEDYSDINTKLDALLKMAREGNVKVVPDVSPKTLEKLGVDKIEQLKDLGFETIRLDYGFDIETTAKLTNLFGIMLNGSTIKAEYLLSLKENGANMGNIWICHNFYPREDTGLGKERFVKVNKSFKELGVRVQAFISGDDMKRFPFFQGLPTLEKHRYMDPYVATIELMKDCFVDDVIIGDSKAKISTLTNIKAYLDNPNVILVKANLIENYEHLYNQEIAVRADVPENVIRLLTERGVSVKQESVFDRNKGAITIDNIHHGRYSGEVQLCRTNLPADARVNVIGNIVPTTLPLLDYIDETVKVKFVK